MFFKNCATLQNEKLQRGWAEDGPGPAPPGRRRRGRRPAARPHGPLGAALCRGLSRARAAPRRGQRLSVPTSRSALRRKAAAEPPPPQRRALSLQPPLRPPLALRPGARPSAPPTNARATTWLPDPRPSPGCPRPLYFPPSPLPGRGSRGSFPVADGSPQCPSCASHTCWPVHDDGGLGLAGCRHGLSAK